jgi:peptidoglycan hydrolase-like protein with peptidoglycan-binding domain
MIIGVKPYQKYLKINGYYDGEIDGVVGAGTRTGTRSLLQERNVPLTAEWGWDRALIAGVQVLFKELNFYDGEIDGLAGPGTDYAVELWQNAMRDQDETPEPATSPDTVWPTYNEMTSFYGEPGTNISLFELPFPMVLAWDTSVEVTRMSLNNKCGPSAIRVLGRVLEHYGYDSIKSLRLNLFGGSYNKRKMRGGSRWSTHAWAAAIDFDPEHNAFRWNHRRASLDSASYDFFWLAWEAEGWVSLGRERDFDWMHVQACLL